MRLLPVKKSISVNFASDNEGRENGSEESGTWHLSLGRLCALSSSQRLLLSFPFTSFFTFTGFILADQGVFCQVSPIKFAPHEHFRTSRYLEIPSTNETEAPIRISRSPPMRDFLSFFHSLFSFLLLPRCFRQKSSSFVRLATRLGRVVESLLLYIPTHSQKRWLRVRNRWLIIETG